MPSAACARMGRYPADWGRAKMLAGFPRGLLCHLNRAGSGGSRRNVLSVLSERLNMQSDCLPDIRSDFFDGGTCRNAAGQIRDICREVFSGVFNYNGVFGHRCLRTNPACRTMLPTVPLASSSPSLPGTVTVPGFD